MSDNKVEKTIFGYATRSLKSAIIMSLFDLYRPFKKHKNLNLDDFNTVIISCSDGLGDLFINLPLISAIERSLKYKNKSVYIATRKGVCFHLVSLLFSNALPIENPIQNFFKGGFSFFKIVKSFLTTRKFIKTLENSTLCIDLTGNAFSSLFYSIIGVDTICSRKTFGGKGFIDIVIPHIPWENMYVYRDKLSNYFGEKLDYSIYLKLIQNEISSYGKNHIFINITTPIKWKTWPIKNFLNLVRVFKKEKFIISGLYSELRDENMIDFELLKKENNVTVLFDIGSILFLSKVIFDSKFVITNDTSTSHIAQAYNKNGIILYGPESFIIWTNPNGNMKPCYPKEECSFHPCVQWKCKNKKNWCMRKISVEEVANCVRKSLDT